MQLARLAVVLACALQPAIDAAVCAQTTPVIVQNASREAEIARVPDAKEGERLMVDVSAGSIDCTVDPKASATRVSAEFTVDGKDRADAERRAKLVRLFAERSSDGTIIVDAIFPGARLPYDAAKVTIVSAPTDEIVLKTTTGAIRTKATTGKLRASTKAGSIAVAGHRGPIDARATGGAIDISGAAEGVQATSLTGAIGVSLADDNDQPFKIESRSGAVRVEVSAEFDGMVSLITSSGALSVTDAAKRVRLSQHSDTHVVAEFGAAASQCEIKTTSGSATLVGRAK